jgi:phosphoheptose isomerase
MCIGTSEFSVVIMRISENGTSDEVLAIIEQAHQNDITSVLALTDYENSLSFVSLSLDSQVKIYSFDGELEYESLADG